MLTTETPKSIQFMLQFDGVEMSIKSAEPIHINMAIKEAAGNQNWALVIEIIQHTPEYLGIMGEACSNWGWDANTYQKIADAAELKTKTRLMKSLFPTRIRAQIVDKPVQQSVADVKGGEVAAALAMGAGTLAVVVKQEFDDMLHGKEVTYTAPMNVSEFVESLQQELGVNFKISQAGSRLKILSENAQMCSVLVQRIGDSTTIKTEGLQLETLANQTLELGGEAADTAEEISSLISATQKGDLDSIISAITRTISEGSEAVEAVRNVASTVTLPKRVAGAVLKVARKLQNTYDVQKAGDGADLLTLKNKLFEATHCGHCGVAYDKFKDGSGDPLMCTQCGGGLEAVTKSEMQEILEKMKELQGKSKKEEN